MSTEEIIPASSAPPPAENPSTTVPSEPAPASIEDKDRPASSPVRKIARPAKARASMPGSSKKGKAEKGSNSFSPGDIVLARLKGFPFWPGRITDPDTAPPEVLKNRTSTKSYIYCVEFFPAGDFAWINAHDINSLSPSDITAYLGEGHRKASSALREAYLTAQDPTEWDEAQAGYRKEKEAAAAAAAEGYDELEEDEAPSGGKRKRATESKSKSKKAKASKKQSAAEVESEEDASKPKKASAAKPAAAKAPDSKPADDDPLANDPECIKVKDWRHKLQRGFLGKGLPESKEMAHYDEIFKTIEGYKNMTIEALQYSKIGKVMKKIAVLDGIARNDELKITDRANKLMHSWQVIIDGKGGDANGHHEANGDAPSTSAPAPATTAVISAPAGSGAPTGSPPAPQPAGDVNMESKPVESAAPALADSAPQSSTKIENSVPAPEPQAVEVPRPEAAMLDTPIYPPVNGQ